MHDYPIRSPVPSPHRLALSGIGPLVRRSCKGPNAFLLLLPCRRPSCLASAACPRLMGIRPWAPPLVTRGRVPFVRSPVPSP